MENGISLKLKIANQSHIKAIHNVMKTVGETIDKESYYVDNEDFISQHISKEGFILIALHNNLVVGFLIVRIPGNNEDNLGLDINIPANELHKVAHIESTAVLKNIGAMVFK